MKFGARELLFLVVMIGLLFSAWFFVFKNADERIKAFNDDTRAKQDKLTEVRAATIKIQNMGKRIDEMQAQIRKIEDALPRGRETNIVIGQIDNLAASFRQLQFGDIVALRSEKASNYWEQPIRIQIKGDFKSFYEFLLRVERLPRIIRINQMRLAKINERDGSMTAEMTLSIYYAPDNAN